MVTSFLEITSLYSYITKTANTHLFDVEFWAWKTPQASGESHGSSRAGRMHLLSHEEELTDRIQHEVLDRGRQGLNPTTKFAPATFDHDPWVADSEVDHA